MADQLDSLLSEGFKKDVELIKTLPDDVKALMDAMTAANNSAKSTEGARVKTIKDVKDGTTALLEEEKKRLKLQFELSYQLTEAARQEALLATKVREAKRANEEAAKATLDTGKASRESAASKRSEREETQRLREEKKREAEQRKFNIALEKQEAKEIAELNRYLFEQNKRIQDNNDAYKQLNIEHKKLESEARQLGALFGEESKQFLNAADKANVFGSKLSAIDAKLGSYRRNVGNYASGFNGLGMSIAQLSREMPAFANSMQTGLMAISNNLPILADEIKKVRQENAELIAQGKAAVPVWRQLAVSIISWQTALSVAITLLTVYGPKVWAWFTNQAQAAKLAAVATLSLKDSVEKLADAYRELNGQIDRSEKLMLAKARAAGATEEQITEIEKEAIRKRRDLRAREIAEYIEEKRKLERLLGRQLADPNAKEDDVKKTQEDINRVKSLIVQSNEELQNLNTDLLTKDYDLRASLRMKREREEAKSLKATTQKEKEELEERLRQMEEFEKGKKELAVKFRNGDYKSDIKSSLESINTSGEGALDIELNIRLTMSERQMQKDLKDIDNLLNQKLTAIHEKYNRGGFKSHEDYEKELLKVSSEYALKRLEISIANSKRMMDILPPESAAYKKYYDELTALDKQFNELKAKNREKDSQDSIKKLKENLSAISDAIGASLALNNELQALGDIYYQKEIDALEHKADLIDRNLQMEISSIKATTRAGEERDKKIHAAEVRADAERRKRDADILKMKRRQAMFDKMANIGAIIGKTALAVVTALTEGDPYTKTFRAIAAGVLGAAELAVALAAPIPSYAEGTKNHPGGKALIGEGGEKELVQEPGGRTWIADRPMIANLPQGTRVIPEHDLMAAGMGVLTPNLIGRMTKQQISEIELSPKTVKAIGRAVSHSSKQSVHVYGVDTYYLKHVKGRA